MCIENLNRNNFIAISLRYSQDVNYNHLVLKLGHVYQWKVI